MADTARSFIILCLGDKVLKEVDREKIVTSMWENFESLYMTKPLTLCLK